MSQEEEKLGELYSKIHKILMANRHSDVMIPLLRSITPLIIEAYCAGKLDFEDLRVLIPNKKSRI